MQALYDKDPFLLSLVFAVFALSFLLNPSTLHSQVMDDAYSFSTSVPGMNARQADASSKYSLCIAIWSI